MNNERTILSFLVAGMNSEFFDDKNSASALVNEIKNVIDTLGSISVDTICDIYEKHTSAHYDKVYRNINYRWHSIKDFKFVEAINYRTGSPYYRISITIPTNNEEASA